MHINTKYNLKNALRTAWHGTVLYWHGTVLYQFIYRKIFFVLLFVPVWFCRIRYSTIRRHNMFKKCISILWYVPVPLRAIGRIRLYKVGLKYVDVIKRGRFVEDDLCRYTLPTYVSEKVTIYLSLEILSLYRSCIVEISIILDTFVRTYGTYVRS